MSKPDLTWLPNDTAFGTAMGDASVHIGGKNPSDHFVPNVNMGKFSDEAWFNMNAHNVQVTNETHTEVDDKVELTVGNETHRIYTLSDTDIEWEVEFAQKPSNNLYEFKLDMSPGVKAYKQVLTQEQLDNGDTYSRPDAEGSYAFYYNKRNNKYKTGKIAHIYRMWIKDSIGTKVWCDMELVGNILTTKMPQASLDSMIYPVTLGPTLGNPIVGVLNGNVTDLVWHTPATISDSRGGVLQGLHAAISISSGDIKMSVANCNQVSPYDPEGFSLVAQAEGTTVVSDDYALPNLTKYASVFPDTYYRVGITLEDNVTPRILYDAGSLYQPNRYTQNYGAEMQNPVPVTADVTVAAMLSIWAVYGEIALMGGGLASNTGVMFLASGGSSEL